LYSESIGSEFSGVEGFLVDVYGLGKFSYTTSDMLPAAEKAMLVDGTKSKRAQGTALGRLLNKIDKRLFGQYRAVKSGILQGISVYKIIKEEMP
jgi:hypothetical protein